MSRRKNVLMVTTGILIGILMAGTAAHAAEAPPIRVSSYKGAVLEVGACGASGPTVSVRAPVSPAWLEAVISTLPSDLATATQQLITCSTATVSGSLEVTVYAAPLGPITRPLRSPASSTVPL